MVARRRKESESLEQYRSALKEEQQTLNLKLAGASFRPSHSTYRRYPNEPTEVKRSHWRLVERYYNRATRNQHRGVLSDDSAVATDGDSETEQSTAKAEQAS